MSLHSRSARRVAAGAAALVLAGAVAACGDSSDSNDEPGNNAAPGEEVTITVQVSGEPEETAVFDLLADAYEEENPSVQVDIVAVESKGDHLAKLSTAFAGGDPPDVFVVNYGEYSQFVAQDAVEPIEPLLEDAGVDLDEYYEQPLEAFTYNDALQCMPQNASSMAVFYNTDLFEAAGLDDPEPGWTWDDFEATADALTDGEVHGVAIEPTIQRLAPFVWSNGGELVDDLESPTRFTLDTPEAREALQYVIDLVRADGVTEEGEATEELEDQFIRGEIGMILLSRRDTPKFREVRTLHWDVAAPPVSTEPATILHGDAFCLSADGEHLDAAAEFVEFATGEQGQGIGALNGRVVPVLKSVAESPAFLDTTQPPAHAQVFLDQLPDARRTPVIPTWREIDGRFEEIFTRAFFDEGYTLDDALADLEDQTADLFEEGTGG